MLKEEETKVLAIRCGNTSKNDRKELGCEDIGWARLTDDVIA
jgi:hypothetical protein